MEIIHIVLGKANPDRLNGVNKVVYNLATEQVKAGKKVQVWGITSNPRHDYPERNFTTKLFKASKFPFSADKNLIQAIKANPDAVFHLHGGWVPVFSRLAYLFSKHQIKYVLTPHGAYNEMAMLRSSRVKKVYFQLFEKFLIAKAHRIHSIGDSEVTGLHKIFPQAASFLLPYGFDIPAMPARKALNQNFTIGFVGRLDTHTKGLDLLIQAFEIFQESIPDCGLWIIGDGEGRQFLENRLTSRGLDRVVLFGKKFGEEKDKLIAGMDVFLHPSRNEGLPTAVLEAAAIGVPVIVSKATNVAGYVQDYQAGIALADNDVDALVSALHEMYRHYKNRAMDNFRVGATHMLEEVFSWPVLIRKFDALYQ